MRRRHQYPKAGGLKEVDVLSLLGPLWMHQNGMLWPLVSPWWTLAPMLTMPSSRRWVSLKAEEGNEPPCTRPLQLGRRS